MQNLLNSVFFFGFYHFKLLVLLACLFKHIYNDFCRCLFLIFERFDYFLDSSEVSSLFKTYSFYY